MKYLISSFLFFLVSVSAEARPEIRFEREIEVSERASYTWDDLVVTKNLDEASYRRLRDFPWTSVEELRASVRDWKLTEDPAQQTLFVLPGTIALKKVKGYSSAEFRRRLLNRLHSLCRDCRIEIQSVQDSKVRIASDWSMDDSAVKTTGSLLVPVSGGNQTAWIPVQIRISRMAAVLRRSVILGQAISASDVELREVDVSHGRETPLRLEDIKDVAAARTMSAGQILFPSDVKREELVKRGQMVKLVAGNGEFEVTMSAIAEQAGRQGEIIRLKVVDSGKVLSGEVIGAGEVRLQ